ncbi:phage tail assembly protein [Pseudobacteriovorax antillogorgiicola]|uniref:Phage tail assembly chaperone protein, E, or 41 or 14 n=1 Tax=Pseudobacteriovorax antillogorgiicola TaxID=1513793 RepID=A0A1Y6CSH0_9BACT|nr:phage tail assembly protein [Pseudobacteriovorax antillogorgiicola]TCS51647.1 tail assembly chaperone E/41/14-like protein [Pseudobacteriovorax antillogorgiicola]SMF84690.1 Phage tail assembly chaperone protein, E, or 41 or 14 [Pseudobacteriovorax antillogorgiicola]
MKYELIYPMEFEGEEITDIKLTEFITVGQSRAISRAQSIEDEEERGLEIMAVILQKPRAFIDQLSTDDLEEISDDVERLLSKPKKNRRRRRGDQIQKAATRSI